MWLQIHTENPEDLAASLRAGNVEVEIPEGRSLGDLQMILVALGGGAGIAAIARGVAVAIEKYLAGKATVSKTKKLTLVVGRRKLELVGASDAATRDAIEKFVADGR